jgi:hypothetical protein
MLTSMLFLLMLLVEVMSSATRNLIRLLNGLYQLVVSGRPDASELSESGCSRMAIPQRLPLNYSLEK